MFLLGSAEPCEDCTWLGEVPLPKRDAKLVCGEFTPLTARNACRLPKSTAAAFVFVLLASISSAIADTHYVNVSNQFSSTPFTNWGTAAISIQDAIDVASGGDTVLVAAGTYDTGGLVVHEGLTNRIAITKAITVSSDAGPANTLIVGQGHWGIPRCAVHTWGTTPC